MTGCNRRQARAHGEGRSAGTYVEIQIRISLRISPCVYPWQELPMPSNGVSATSDTFWPSFSIWREASVARWVRRGDASVGRSRLRPINTRGTAISLSSPSWYQ
ncbi:MAG: hypothetical protein BJ554DRAFT_2491 [Olpidium bornovanus]|uniref:Uncharacterized protein n=1 Tax=Olpidium bornovanus TaxID=278681 RepID=A0A8H7ZQE2_9FUNG|nr:MAG: hypothetical protein BJ554DRAFT_2491 [Olpidium bornovanus]